MIGTCLPIKDTCTICNIILPLRVARSLHSLANQSICQLKFPQIQSCDLVTFVFLCVLVAVVSLVRTIVLECHAPFLA